MNRILRTNDSKLTIIIRLVVGAVFLSEGIQKFLYPEIRGVGRFIKLGVFEPEIMGPFVGGIEIVAGSLIIIGFATRIWAILTAFIMLFAIYYTQIPVLIEDGFWFMANRIRTDWSMLLCSIYLLISGSGKWSIDNSQQANKS